MPAQNDAEKLMDMYVHRICDFVDAIYHSWDKHSDPACPTKADMRRFIKDLQKALEGRRFADAREHARKVYVRIHGQTIITLWDPVYDATVELARWHENAWENKS